MSAFAAIEADAAARGESLADGVRHHLLHAVVARIARHPEARAAFVLRGGLLTRAWLAGAANRRTRDLDLVGDFAFDRDRTRALFAAALAGGDDDLVVSDLTDAVIWGHTAFPGVRFTLRAGLGAATEKLAVDVGFHDPLVPAPVETLGVRVVRPETQLAWKLHALAEMRGTFRPKDVADALLITRHVPLVDDDLAPAIAAAFTSRGFPLASARATLAAPHWPTKPSRVRWDPYRDALGELAPAIAAILARLDAALAALQPWDRRHTEATWAVASLLADHGRAWRAELPALPGIAWTTFERGFCSTVKADNVAALYAAAAAIPQIAPVVRAEFEVIDEAAHEFPAEGIPWLRILRIECGWRSETDQPRLRRSILSAGSELEIDLDDNDDAASVLQNLPANRPLARLVMPGEHTGGLALAERLADAPWARGLHTLQIGTSFVDMDTGYFDDPTMRERGAELLAGAKLFHITKLSVANQRVGAAGLTAILKSMPRVDELTATRCELDDIGALAGATGTPLVALDLAYNTFLDGGAGAVVAMPRAMQLESLSLRACGIGPAGVESLARAACWQSLFALNLGKNELGIDGVVALVDAMPPPHLTKLQLDDCDLDADAARILASVPWLAELFALDIGKNPIAGNGELLAAIADSEILAIGARAIGLDGAAAAALAPAWSRVRTLDLRRNPLGDAGFAALVTDEESPIVELDLSHCQLTSASLATFARMRAPQLRALRLENNPLSLDKRSDWLAELIRLPMFAHVAELDISRCGFGDDLPHALSRGGPLPVLHSIRARGHQLSGASVFRMAELASENLPGLGRVRVGANLWQQTQEQRVALNRRFGYGWSWERRPSATYLGEADEEFEAD